MLIKVKFNEDVRRIEIDGNPPTFKELRGTVRKLFALGETPFVLKYLDDENDSISLTNDKELAEALHFLVAPQATRSFLRLAVHLSAPKAATAKASTSSTASSPSTDTVHDNIACDGCGASPIRGIRYKCGMCPNFDFCEKCESSVAHDGDHIFVKIRKVIPWSGYGTRRPLLHFNPYAIPAAGPWAGRWGNPAGGDGNACPAFAGHPRHPWGGRRGGPHCSRPEVVASTEEGAAATSGPASPEGHGPFPFPFWGFGHPHGHHWGGRRGGHCGRPETPSAEDAPKAAGAEDSEKQESSEEQPWKRRCGGGGFWGRRGGCHGGGMNRARCSSRFVEDVTVPDGTQVQAGSTFEKVWKLKNDGEVAWPAGTKLVFMRGQPMGDAEIAIDNEVAPGESIEFRAVMTAPQRMGRAVGVYRLFSPEGFKFGHRVWVDVCVVPSSAETVVETETAEEKANETVPAEKESEAAVDEPVIVVADDEPVVIQLATEEAVKEEEPSSKPEPTPAPSAAAAPAAAETPLEPAVAALVAMGFKDVDANRRALARRHGDVVRAVHDLLRI